MLLLLACAATPAVSSDRPSTNPLASIHRTPDAPGVHGRVAEVLVASHYRYLRFEGEPGWHVILSRTPVQAGDEVTLGPIGALDHFHSQSLDKDFAPLTFSVRY